MNTPKTEITGYNVPHINHLDTAEVVALSYVLPEGLSLRWPGGEIAKNMDYRAADHAHQRDKFLILARAAGRIKFVLPRNYAQGALESLLEVIDELDTYGNMINKTYKVDICLGNEEFYGLNHLKHVIKDLWTYLRNREEYYRKHARALVAEAEKLRDLLKLAAYDSENAICLNIPLPQNKYYQAYGDEIGKVDWIKSVDVHVYVKQREPDFFEKLEGWLAHIQGYGKRIIAGEVRGLWHDGMAFTDVDLKDSDMDRENTRKLVDLLKRYGVAQEDIYHFCLCGNTITEQWWNAPVFHRYQLDGITVTDTLKNVYV